LATTGGEMRAAGGAVEVRLDGPAGELVGQSDLAAAAPRGRGAGAAGLPRGGGRGSGTATIALRPASGVHDLYFVFKNDQAAAGQPLMTVTDIRVN